MNKVIYVLHVVYVIFTSVKNALDNLFATKPENTNTIERKDHE